MKKPKRILIAALNWGLGHATRCMPIIDALLNLDYELVLASDGESLKLWKEAYPHLEVLALPTYDIHYKGRNMIWNILPQGPKIFRTIYKERKIVKTIIKSHQIDLIISDNRYGLYHKSIPTVLMTHQLNIRISSPFLQRFIAWNNKFFLSKFTACWVPDYKDEPSLAGDLSHGTNWLAVEYIGPLSRMKPYSTKKIYDLIIVLSGPEPQRTFLEQKICKQLKGSSYCSLLVRGKPSEKRERKQEGNLEIVSFMHKEELNRAIAASEIVLARSGYSTLMDLMAIGVEKIFFVPTPGQTEQEYLARRFAAQGFCIQQKQEELNIKRGIDELNSYITQKPKRLLKIDLQQRIDHLISKL